MPFDLQVSSKTFAQILQSHPKLEIPPFQRPYAWEARQWAQLWGDMTTRLKSDYLMGNVVMCGTDAGSELLIDGQQRLTTITIFVAVLRDYLWLECGGELAKRRAVELHKACIVGSSTFTDDHNPTLILGDVDRQWFRNRIQVSPESEGEYRQPPINSVPYKQPGSNRLMGRAYQFLYRQLQKRHSAKGFANEEEKVEDVMGLADQLAHKTWFVITRVPDDTQAYTLFEVLNDRGLELSISDLIKNVLLSHATEVERLDRAKDFWSEIAAALDYQNISAFIRYHWMSTNGRKITESDLFPKIKAEIKKMSATELVKFLKTLSSEAENYAQIIGRGTTTGEAAAQLELMRAYGFRVVNSLLLAIWATSTDEKFRAQAVRSLKNFLVQYATFANQVTNDLEALLAELSASLRRSGKNGFNALVKRLKQSLPSQTTVWDEFSKLEPNISVARAILSEIEAHLTGDEKTIAGTDKVNIEHIFPQSPDHQWVKTFAAEGAEDSYVARLGNLTLLSAKLNKQASNKSFNEKLARHYKKSDFKITKGLEDYASWTVKSVEKRQAELLRLAKKVWAL
jgi:uncharacterized protein with ParB-like and HNH nuclease domain